MKKIAIAAVSILVLAGCNNIPPAKTNLTNLIQTNQPIAYVCNNNTKFMAKFDQDSDIATLILTAPQLHLDNQEIKLKRVAIGSNERFLNDTNPNSIYEWRFGANKSIFAIKTPNGDVIYNCQINKKQ